MGMRNWIGLGFILAIALLSGCDAPGSQPGSPAAQNTVAPAAGASDVGRAVPRGSGTRPANGTPQAGGAAAAAATPKAAGSLLAPTAVVGSIISGANGVAPTAVPIPVITLPTAAQASVPGAGPSAVPSPAVTRAALPTIAPLSPARSAVTLSSLHDRIVFFSERGAAYPQLYIMDADGGNQQLCSCSDLLPVLLANEVTSPDKKQFLFIKSVGASLRNRADDQIWAHNNETGYEAVVTGAAPGFPGVDYDPVWSPDSKHIAWVTEANGFDEIYLYDSITGENSRLTQSSGEWYKHPSFSPDGSQIVYWTNKSNSLYKQIWAIDIGGESPRNLSANPYNDWDPIWVK